MKKNILLIFSFLTSVFAVAQEVSPVSTPANADVPTVVETTTQQVVVQQPVQVQRFGYFSYNEAIKSMPEYIQAQNSLEKLKKYYDQEMERSEQEFTKKFSEFIDGYKSFPENIMLKRQKELQQLMEQSMAFKNEAQQLLNKSENELMAPVHEKMKEALKKLGTERNYSYILNTDNNAYPFINTMNGQGEDITDAVIKLIK